MARTGANALLSNQRRIKNEFVFIETTVLVSHAMNHTRRRFLPNLQNHRFWVESEKRFVKLRVSTKGMRIIDKKGIDAVLADLRARGEKV